MEVKYPQVTVKDFGRDGNAFFLIGQCLGAAKKAKLTKEQQDEFSKEAMSGDYDHVIQTCLKYFDCKYIGDSDEDPEDDDYEDDEEDFE